MSDLVTRTTQDGIVTLALNQPDTRNAISELPMIDAIVGALQDADADPDTRVIILTGEGSCFSSGGNIKSITAHAMRSRRK
ncbi:MAG: enoyl-CoA hydratase-related protein [Parasphingopyxis sp.]|uniref:enoyl-CoA hydratase-related protein n=1 Tax=Parasphingopyxis sp. TaxID=1920299 RepID=UPI00260823A0|nr:enoyl-CoA hydratase-related protein [uncultured Parasphingopyxis sp.]